MQKLKILPLLFFVLFAKSTFATNYDTLVFNPVLEKMRFFSDTLRNCYNQEKRLAANDSFLVYMKEFVELEGSFDVTHDSISSVMFKLSNDKKVRVITWLVADNSGNYKSYGVIQHKPKKGEVVNIWLKEKLNHDMKEHENEDYSQDEWPGGLIYFIQEFKYKRKTRYLILSFHGLGRETNRKSVDAITIEDETATFGLPVFMRYANDPDPNYRMVFNFSDQATMMLRFDSKLKMIVFDQMVPAASVVGGSEFMVPDGTYGALIPQRNGKWKRVEDFGEYKKWGEE